MFKLSGFIFLFTAIFCGVLLFETSQSVQSLESELAAIQSQNQKEKDEIRVLATEWDFLNRPQRLEGFVNGTIEKSSFQIITSPADIAEPAVPVLPTAKPVQKEEVNIGTP